MRISTRRRALGSQPGRVCVRTILSKSSPEGTAENSPARECWVVHSHRDESRRACPELAERGRLKMTQDAILGISTSEMNYSRFGAVRPRTQSWDIFQPSLAALVRISNLASTGRALVRSPRQSYRRAIGCDGEQHMGEKDRGRDTYCYAPPRTEPDVRLSRIRLHLGCLTTRPQHGPSYATQLM